MLTALVVIGTTKPEKPLPPPPAPPKKSVVACFMNGKPVFSGEVLGRINLGTDGKISFFSSDMNAEVQLLNASCMVLKNP